MTATTPMVKPKINDKMPYPQEKMIKYSPKAKSVDHLSNRSCQGMSSFEIISRQTTNRSTIPREVIKSMKTMIEAGLEIKDNEKFYIVKHPDESFDLYAYGNENVIIKVK